MTAYNALNRLVALYDEMDVSIMVLDAQTGQLVYMNQRVCKDMGLLKEQMLGMHYRRVFWEEFHQVYEILASSCKDGNIHTDVFHWTSRMIWEQISARHIEWAHGQTAVLLIITNITDVSRSMYEYKQMAYYDHLLNIPNKHSLKQDIHTIQSFDDVGAIRFDICRLSGINDLYGWEVGDLLLLRIRDWLLKTGSSSTKTYRIYESGFCLILKEANQADMERHTKIILDRFKKPWLLSIHDNKKTPVYCDIKMGVIFGSDLAGETQDFLFHTLGKHISGNGGYILYDKKHNRSLKAQMRLRQDLIRCVRQNMKGFSVCYHPVVDSKTWRWAGVEALCRWENPGDGIISPTIFIKEAEQLGLIATLDNWVYKTAMKCCRDTGLDQKDFFLNINFSPIRPIDDQSIHELVTLSDEVGYPTSKLGLEITESAKIEFSSETINALNVLKKNKVILALDDFGTGYSSFENMLRLPVNILKVDRSMVENIEHDANKQHLMKSVIKFAHFANMVLIAEGVETDKQKELLQNYGVDYMQGFLFSTPLSVGLLQKQKHRFD